MSPCFLDKWRLVFAELNAGAKVGGGHGACDGEELACAAAMRATCRRGGVTQSSSPYLLARGSVLEAHRFSGGDHDGRMPRCRMVTRWRQSGERRRVARCRLRSMEGRRCGGGGAQFFLESGQTDALAQHYHCCCYYI